MDKKTNSTSVGKIARKDEIAAAKFAPAKKADVLEKTSVFFNGALKNRKVLIVAGVVALLVVVLLGTVVVIRVRRRQQMLNGTLNVEKSVSGDNNANSNNSAAGSEADDEEDDSLPSDTPDYGENVDAAISGIDAELEKMSPESDFKSFSDISY